MTILLQRRAAAAKHRLSQRAEDRLKSVLEGVPIQRL
jgi:hypothetical protein